MIWVIFLAIIVVLVAVSPQDTNSEAKTPLVVKIIGAIALLYLIFAVCR